MTTMPVVNSRSWSLLLSLSLIALFLGLSLLPAGAQPVEVSIPDIQATDDPSGDSPLLGQVVTVDGIVTALNTGDGGLQGYFIQDPEGGPWSGVYVSDASGDRPVPGDLVSVTGQVDEVLGLTVVSDLEEFTVVSNDNPLPAARGIATDMLQSGGEPWESVWVAVHGLTVISENPDAPDDFGEWLVADVTDATVRVGHLLGDYEYTPVEGDVLAMIRGIAYYSFGSFKIEPTTTADVLDQAGYTTIYAIQKVPEDGDDASPLTGERVTTTGIVTGLFFPDDGGVRYVVEDPRGGLWSGVWVVDEVNDAPPRGAHIELTGTVREFFGRTELFEVDPESVVVHSVNNVLPAAVDIETIDVATGRPSAEKHEGVLVRTGQVTVTNANADAPDDFGEWLIADAVSGASIRVDDLGEYSYTPLEGDELAFVGGPVDFTFDQFKIQPRDDGDIGTTAVTIGQARQRPLGEEVILEGVVTVPSGLFDAGFAIQDGTGGIYVYRAEGFLEAVGLGDVVDVVGTLANPNGRLQVVPVDPANDVQIVGIAPLPRPFPWPTGNIGESSEGWLVWLEGVITEKVSDRLVLNDGSGPADVVVLPGTDIDLSSVLVGQEAMVIGLSSQFDEASPFDSGYRVLPRSQTDVNPGGSTILTPTSSPSPTATPTPMVPATSTLEFPFLFKSAGGCTSVYTLTNSAEFAANVQHTLTDRNGTTYILADTIEPASDKTYNLASAAFTPELPEGFAGSGTIASDSPLTGSVQVCPQGTAASVTVRPASVSVGLGGLTTSDIQADVAGLYGAEVHLEFDPNVLQVVDADPRAPGVQVKPGSIFAADNFFQPVHRVDNEAGTIDFAATLLAPAPAFSGVGNLLSVTWRGAAPGVSSIRLRNVELSDPGGQSIAATWTDGAVTVLQATATPTSTPTSTPTATATPSPTSTPTPEIIPTPACDGGVCSGSIVVRAFYDFRCDGSFVAGLDRGVGGARATLQYDNGARVVAETVDHNAGYAWFSGVNVPAGTRVTVSIDWPAMAEGSLEACPNSRESVTLRAEDFQSGARFVSFRAVPKR